MENERSCYTCHEVKPVLEFYKGQYRCKDCDKKRALSRTSYSLRKNWMKNYALKYPYKLRARDAVQKSIKKGAITKGPCEVCGSDKVQAHHYLGYEPEHYLSVKWLCKEHHLQEHHARQER